MPYIGHRYKNGGECQRKRKCLGNAKAPNLRKTCELRRFSRHPYEITGELAGFGLLPGIDRRSACVTIMVFGDRTAKKTIAAGLDVLCE